MRLTVLSPRRLLDEDKLSSDASRNMKEVFDKWFDVFFNTGVTIEYFIEDDFSREYLKSKGYEKVIASSQLHEEDIAFRKSVSDSSLSITSLISEKTLKEWDKRYVRESLEKRKIPIPILRQYRSRDEWIAARSDYSVKMQRMRLTEYIKTVEAVAVFRAPSNNMCPSLKDEVKVGDGRLYLEIDITTGIASAYYGGCWVEADFVKTILSL